MPMFEDSAFDWGGRTNHSESVGNSKTQTFTIHSWISGGECVGKNFGDFTA